MYTQPSKHTHTKIRGGTGTDLPANCPPRVCDRPDRRCRQCTRSGSGYYGGLDMSIHYGTAVAVTQAWHDSFVDACMHTHFF